MQNDNNTQGNNNQNTGNEGKGTIEQGDSGTTQNTDTNTIVLDSSPTQGGTQHTEEQAQGTNAHESKAIKLPLDWSFASIWNKALESGDQRKAKVRDYLYASELYYAPVDTWLKMRATPYTNPPNARALRKFEAGHLTEWIVTMVLTRAGILKAKELRGEYTYPGLLRVSGRMDHVAGGMPDYERAMEELKVLELPEGFMRGAENIIKTLRTNYPQGLGEKPIEIKSVSSFAMDSMERKNIPIKSHRVQLYHYLKSANYAAGLLVYICRDDLRMMEFPILLESNVENEYRERIELLTKFHGETTRPKKEVELIWEEDFAKFSKNLNIEYSPYLTLLYGYETPREYSEQWAKKATSWNGVLKRIKNKADMTKKNLAYIEDMKKEGYDPIALAAQMPDNVPEEEEAASE